MSDSGVRLDWTGPDGSTWDWLDGTAGVVLGEGIDGILFPDFEQLTTPTPAGRRYNGTRWKPATVEATLQVCDTRASAEVAALGGQYRRGAAWRTLDRRVRASVSPTSAGRLTCTADGQSRWLDLRLESIGHKLTKMPDIRGLVEYDVELVDDEPFWKGQPVPIDFPYQEVATEDYYGGATGVGPPLMISAGNNSSSGVEIANPGDVDSWLTWEITGPVQATIGTPGATTAVPFLGDGERLTIITNPIRRDVLDESGARAWHKLDNRRFEPVPAGDQVPLVVEMASAGPGSNVRVTLEPMFLGAY